MKPRALAYRLAVSATQGAWSLPEVQAVLARRLPPAHRHLAKDIAAAMLSCGEGSDLTPPPQVVARALPGTPAFENLYLHCRNTNVWPAPETEPPVMRPLPPFDGLDLPQLPTEGELAAWLMLSPERLAQFADLAGRAEASPETAINHYFYRVVPKRAGGVRLIEAPKPALKGLQRQVLRGILDPVPVHRDAFGFVRGRGVTAGAARHAGEAVVLRFDLADFFHSVGRGRVFGIFRAMGYPHNAARCLAGLTTTAAPPWIMERLGAGDRPYLRIPHLPQGAPTSPALANLSAFGLDRRLAGLARRLGAAWSRYADDICFSGDPDIVAPLMAAVPGIVAEEGFRLNAAKTRVMRAQARQCVTGLVVNRHLNLPREEFDRLKAIIHRAASPGDARLADPRFRAALAGRIAWAEAVNPARGAKLRARLEAALAQKVAL
ncbi:RNA-directed DNA polymerase [Limibaculum sp. M0105]|uniref:RNA-directed DNA polymerase n=1 Tax=Thermohalobaculum xanthum TaxID=2753746 RepID=A0A8J7SEF0_9RHOB|nr:reverse transcriptase family protein [Thermohalobaculum xanthum]MBK0397850.1 RNA-directed DNA polymerase [Thermohalobaculum xanthum]